MAYNRILILGIGNSLLSDEGFGPAALDFLETYYAWPDNVRLVNGGTGGMLLMADLMDCDVAIILDAMLGNSPPGTFYFLEGQDLYGAIGSRQSMHQTSIGDVLTCCELAGSKPETCIFGFEPFDCTTVSPNLTQMAQSLLPAFCECILARLKEYAIQPIKY